MTTTSKPQTAVFRGKAQYAKVLGEPMLNYNKDGKEWKIDVVFAVPDSSKYFMLASNKCTLSLNKPNPLLQL